MARVKLMPGIESISGTIGNLTFRTCGGRTFVHAKVDPELPPRATRSQREKWLRTCVVNRCMRCIQGNYAEIREAISARALIRQRVVALYIMYRKETGSMTKLLKKVTMAYYEKYGQPS